jgi:hypothetical protein
MGKRMKGQFFLLAAFFLLLAFYLGVSAHLSPTFAKPEIGSDISGLFANIEGEYPRVANFGLASSDAAAALADFSMLAANLTDAQGAELKVLWILTENEGGDLNVTVGNFLGSARNVTLNVSGDIAYVLVNDGEVDSAIFASPPSEFSLRLNFNTGEKNLLLEREKANLYTFIEMSKGNDVIRGENRA